MRELAAHVHRAVSLARLGRDESAIAELSEARNSLSSAIDAPSRSLLQYVRSMAAVGADRNAALCLILTIGDDIDDAEIAVTLSNLLRWAESRWVTDACLDRLRSECSQQGPIKAAQLAVALSARARNLARDGLPEEAAIVCRDTPV
jgi:hypothetical protein